MARKSLSKKNRFEVFKRDGFTCQYCGRMAPELAAKTCGNWTDFCNIANDIHGGDS